MTTVLGINFQSEDERRQFFREELRKKLPELRRIEGFPIGTEADILALSDPPFYTACPNPWLNDFIKEWETAKQFPPFGGQGGLRTEGVEVSEPYAADVSEGKNNPIYNAHSYHTKVPHPAIMRYILHYTQPGDIVFDGFAGTGMTGVAAQLCANPDPTTKHVIEKEFKNQFGTKPVWGVRRAILGDLSPVASFIAYNYNAPVDVEQFDAEARRILKEVEAECGWMYQTKHADGKMGTINYTVWSDVFACGNCGEELVFWNEAVNIEKKKLLDEFPCRQCQALQNKKNMEKVSVSYFDKAIGETIRQTKTKPVLIYYTFNKKRFEKKPDAFDLELIEKIENTEGGDWFPTDKMMNKGENWGDTWRSGVHSGVTHVHQFYTKRNLTALALFNKKVEGEKTISNNLKFILTGMINRSTTMNRIHISNFFFGGGGWNVGHLKGTLYIPSLPMETSILEQISDKANSYISAKRYFNKPIDNLLNVCSATNLLIAENSIDYIFTDPPFGANIMYSELNFLWESWLKVKTNNASEAIENRTQGKGFGEYAELMRQSFAEYYRILKHGKWMTVEFSNTSAGIWNGIQTALQKVGFIISNVSALDKKQGGMRAIIGAVAVRQDLVISCYKPSADFDNSFERANTEGVGISVFLNEHLQYLPIHLSTGNATTAVVERSAKILYDRLISFYIMRGLPVPLDARAFQDYLKTNYLERDGMYFLAEQAVEYDTKRRDKPEFVQGKLFDSIATESEAIQWLKDRLTETAQSRPDIYTDFIKAQLGSTSRKDRLPELDELLEDNFLLNADGKTWRAPDAQKAADLDTLRLKKLLKTFNQYAEQAQNSKTRRLKDVRLEALRAGFRHNVEEKNYGIVVAVGDKLDPSVLQEDEFLLVFYDIAKNF